MCDSQIWQNFEGDKYLCRLGKEYLNASICKFVVYSLQHSETFDISHVFLTLAIAELSTLKQVRFFGCRPAIAKVRYPQREMTIDRPEIQAGRGVI